MKQRPTILPTSSTEPRGVPGISLLPYALGVLVVWALAFSCSRRVVTDQHAPKISACESCKNYPAAAHLHLKQYTHHPKCTGAHMICSVMHEDGSKCMACFPNLNWQSQ